MAEKFDEFMEEVENDIRQEKYLTLWRRYGNLVMGISLIGFLGILGNHLWSQYDFRERSKASGIFLGAQHLFLENRKEEALTALKTLENQITPYDILAKMTQAGILAKGENAQKKQAIQLYQGILEMKNLEKSWRDIALYQKIILQTEEETYPLEVALKELELIDITNSPVGDLSAELKASLLFKKGEKTQAGEIFVTLAQSNTAPQGVVERSRLMTQVISGQLK